MNSIILIMEVIVVFSCLVGCYKLFGKTGMIAWVGMATILANVITAKNANVFGLSTAIGTVMFASTFLATDILTEYHSVKDARTAVYVGLFSDVMLIIATQIALLYQPSEFDYADGAMQTLFALNLRISLASMVMYVIANLVDVQLYHTLKEKSKGKKLWLRNNVSTIICNCAENFGFIGLAFAGIYDWKTIATIALSTSVIEAMVAICDTPFLYIAGLKKTDTEYVLSADYIPQQLTLDKN